MASVIGGMLQTAFAGLAFAGLAFAGSGYLFKIIYKNGYEQEMKRHNRALKQLAASKEKFYENKVKQHDRIQRLRQELADANEDLERTNKALDTLRRVQSIEYHGQTFNRELQLSDFYKPSKEMEEYQYIAIGSVGIGARYLISRYI